MRLALQVRDQYQGSSSDAAYRLAQHLAGQSNSASDFSEQSNSSPSNYNTSPPHDVHFAKTSSSVQAADAASSDDLQTTLITFLASLDENAPGSLRRSGAVNTRNEARQTLLHIATVMGFHRLVRRLVVIGAHLDLQDFNGYTALGLASLCGQLTCARVLIEAGSSYDRPTAFGEMPLDLAKAGDNRDVEALLLSAVWSTQPDAPMGSASIRSTETDSEIDNDNPSSGSDDELSRVLWNRNSRTARGKQKPARPSSLSTSPRRSRRCSLSGTPRPAPITPLAPRDAPPAYDAPVDSASWMSRTLSSIPHPPGLLPGAVWDRLPMVSIFGPDKASSHGWIAFPAPSWETLQKMASPEEVKLFTQAMAAAAFNAVVQSGATTTSSPLRPSRPLPDGGDRARKSKSAHRSHRFKSESPAGKVVKHVKRGLSIVMIFGS